MNKICSIEGCGRKHKAKGLCRKHYGRIYDQTHKEQKKKRVSIWNKTVKGKLK
jgi:hypothetical protein